MGVRKPEDDHGKLVIELEDNISCPSCGSDVFVYGDHASIPITIDENGQVEYHHLEATYAGEVEYIKCKSCGKDLPKEIQDKLIW